MELTNDQRMICMECFRTTWGQKERRAHTCMVTPTLSLHSHFSLHCSYSHSYSHIHYSHTLTLAALTQHPTLTTLTNDQRMICMEYIGTKKKKRRAHPCVLTPALTSLLTPPSSHSTHHSHYHLTHSPLIHFTLNLTPSSHTPPFM
jgi:hypothetical protein